MRARLLLFSILLSVCSFAQNNLSTAYKRSVYTYVYKIDTEEATKLYNSDMRKASEAYLHTLTDSFQKDEPALPEGNYLFVQAVRSKLEYELKQAGNLLFKLINNNRDLVIALHTKSGEPITGAKVFINKKELKYDAATQTFRRDTYKKGGLLKVYYHDVVYAFQIEPFRSYHQSFWQRLHYSFPLRYIINPISKLFGKKYNRNYNFFYDTPYEKKFSGFMVCSKPKYKPGDTVKLKAFVTDKKGAPLSEKLLLRISNNALDVDTIIAVITPYRKGAYEYSFVLNDSLDMDLDEEYTLTLEEERSRKYTIDEDKDYDDEDAFVAQRKVVMRGRFHFEEYELSTIQFAARSDKQDHNRGEEVALYLKATDENDMAVMDGRVQVFIKASAYGDKNFGAPKVFIRDTLWQQEQALDAVGETKISLPDSIFPQASFQYEIECVFLNSNNERQTKSLYQHFYHPLQRLQFTQKSDSLQIEIIEGGKSIAGKAKLYAFNSDDDTLLQQFITLPASVRLHPFAKTYEVETVNVNKGYEVKRNSSPVSALASRAKDSVFIQLINPYRLPVWYTIFAGNKVLLRGKGDSLFYADKVRTAKHYFVSLQYIYNDAVQNEDYTVPYRDKLLSLSFIQPDVVYPGQKTEISIDVKNAEGTAVADADVTAWAFTKKFGNVRTPNVPYFGKWYAGRKRHANFKEEEKEFEATTKLAWQRWSREMHLDTMEYYKFLHPTSIYNNSEPAPDSVTQIAPFIVKDGELQPVHLLYIDEVPVFFSAAQQLNRYSFPVSAGKHSFRFRTHNSLITLDSFYMPKGVKTFISIDVDSAKNIHVQEMKEMLTAYEKALWNKYMLLVENNFGEKYASIKSWNSIYLLNPYQRYGVILTGPLPNSDAQIEVKNGFTQNFDAEGGYQYQFKKGLVKQKQLPQLYGSPLELSAAEPAHNFKDYVLTEKEIDSLWQVYLYNRSASEELFRNASLMKKDNGELQIGVTKDSLGKEHFIRHLFLFKYNDPDFLRIYKGQARNLGYLQPGAYCLLLLLKDDAYFIKDSIVIKKDGLNYYETGKIVPRQKDSVSLRISAIIGQRDKAFLYSENAEDFNSIKESFNEKYLDASLLTQTISGTVRDNKGNPIVGATVTTKGTGARHATTTDRFGRFTLQTMPNSTIVISSVGYTSQEMKANHIVDYSFRLAPMESNLQEVVVVGYSTTRKMDLTGSVSSVSANMLQGKIAGIMIRGTGTIDGNASPLLVVDGIPFSGKLEDLDPSLIASTDILKDAAATSLYGARGANGVIMITTKKGKQDAFASDNSGPANSLRRSFRDDAWWQPKLRTNAEGKASFIVTYPDDITAW